MSDFILAIDQGTTGTTALLVASDVNIVAKVNIEFTQHYPKPGWVEHDAVQIWNVTVRAISECLAKAGIDGSRVKAIGITNQRETTVVWERATGAPIHKAIVWQDRRTASVCEKLRRDKAVAKFVRGKTGLVLDPYFSATKIAWILKNVPGAMTRAKAGELAFGTIDTWLIHNLTGGGAHVTDVSNASRTLLMDLKTLAWDDKLLNIFGVPKAVLPEIRSCSESYGATRGVPGLPDGIPIAGVAGDQQSALFGQACFNPGEAKCTYGTGSFLLMNIGAKPVLSRSGLITTVAWKIGKNVVYALEGSSFIAGAAVQWLRDEMKIIDSSHDVESLAESVADSGGVSFVPALAGLGAPYWDPHARGLLCGLTRGSNRGHIARATLEGIALSQYDILTAMQKDAGKKLKTLKVDGGASANNLLMQFQADVLNRRIVRPRFVETTGLGAAFLAGLATGFWNGLEDIRGAFHADREFVPLMKPKARAEKIAAWQTAVKRALHKGS